VSRSALAHSTVPEEDFGLAPAVDVGGIDDVDPCVERTVRDPCALLQIGAPEEPTITAPRQQWLTFHVGPAQGRILIVILLSVGSLVAARGKS